MAPGDRFRNVNDLVDSGTVVVNTGLPVEPPSWVTRYPLMGVSPGCVGGVHTSVAVSEALGVAATPVGAVGRGVTNSAEIDMRMRQK
jgi:hypothetical protein